MLRFPNKSVQMMEYSDRLQRRRVRLVGRAHKINPRLGGHAARNMLCFPNKSVQVMEYSDRLKNRLSSRVTRPADEARRGRAPR